MLKSGIIDSHTHAFPDEIAVKAISALEAGCGEKAYLDGTISDLLRSMDNAGIEKSIVANIATKPTQFEPILKWSQTITSDRIIPFLSVHPADPERLTKIDRIKQTGFKGIKLHPYYQDFYLDEPVVYEMFARIEQNDLTCLVHTGFDIAFERVRRCDPARIAKVVKEFPKLKFVSTHFGAWQDWEEVRKYLIGKPVYMEISLSLEFLEQNIAKQMLEEHPAQYLLFGTDSPWSDQSTALKLLESMGLDEARYERMLRKNAMDILSI